MLIHYKKYVSWKNAVSHSLSKKYITDHNHLLVNSDLVYDIASLAVGNGNTANKTVRVRVIH